MTLVSSVDDRSAHGVTLAVAFRVWTRIALLSFGGPAGQIAVMHRILVSELRWISERRFLHALNYCMLLPGPEAQQLATYIGWLMHGAPGGLMAGLLFILPGAVAIMGLSLVYVSLGKLAVVSGIFFGLKAAVLTIVLQAVIRVGRRALNHPLLKAMAGVSFVSVFFFNVPFPLIILATGLVGLMGRNHPALSGGVGHGTPATGPEPLSLIGDAECHAPERALACALKTALLWLVIWLAPVAILAAMRGDGVFADIAIFFSKMAVVTFGGAYAVLTYVAQQAVGSYHWLEPGQMLDGLGTAETTPGPLIMVLQFVGFLAAFHRPGGMPPMLAGAIGGLIATWVTFCPCFLWIFVGAPFIERLRGNRYLSGALTAITAAVVGVILNLAIWFALHILFRASVPVRDWGLHADRPILASLDPWSASLAVVAAVAVFRFRCGMAMTLGGAALAGAAITLAGLV